MEVTRLTFRIPKDLYKRIMILANQNNISINRQLIELIEFGIKYFLGITNSINIENRNDKNEY